MKFKFLLIMSLLSTIINANILEDFNLSVDTSNGLECRYENISIFIKPEKKLSTNKEILDACIEEMYPELLKDIKDKERINYIEDVVDKLEKRINKLHEASKILEIEPDLMNERSYEVKEKKDFYKSKIDILNKNVEKKFLKEVDYNGYILPPRPNMQINNSTILGIDTNNNYVRDDVERILVSNSVTQSELGENLQAARIIQMLLMEKDVAKLALFPRFELLIYQNEFPEYILNLTLNNRKRSIAFNQINDGNNSLTDFIYFNKELASKNLYIEENHFNNLYHKDFKFDNKENFSGYSFDMDFYKENYVPIFNESGIIKYYIYEGKVNEILDYNKFCKINFNIDAGDECTKLREERRRLFLYSSFEELYKKGIPQKILKNKNIQNLRKILNSSDIPLIGLEKVEKEYANIPIGIPKFEKLESIGF